jgi:hypothetical protein
MSRAGHLFKRFGTLQEQLHEGTKAIQRINKAGEFLNENREEKEETNEDLNEQEDDELGLIHNVMGVGASEGHGKSPGYAKHGPDYVKFAGMTSQGIPFVATMPFITPTDGIAWVNERIKGFKQNPKSRESIEEAIKRKALAAMGVDFVDAMRLKAGDMANSEMDTMFSEKSHSGIGNLDLISKRPDVVHITISTTGEITGMPDGVLKDNNGQIYMTQDMVGRI